MSTVTVPQLKDYLHLIHDSDDTRIQALINAAESYVLAFVRHDSLELDESDIDAPSVPDAVTHAVKMIVEARGYADPDTAQTIMAAAEALLTPWIKGFACA